MSSGIKTKVCEVLQLETKTNNLDYESGFKLFKLYEKQIIQAPKSVRNIFTIENIVNAFANFRRINDTIFNCTKKTESLKLPLYKNLADPCFLLIFSSNIQNNKVGKIYDFFYSDRILIDLISLSSALLHKKYFPRPTKRIFIRATHGKMHPLGIASSLDRIVQRALIIVITPRMNVVFSGLSYGFRQHSNNHSAIKGIYRR